MLVKHARALPWKAVPSPVVASLAWQEWLGLSAAWRGAKATRLLEEFPGVKHSFNFPGLKSAG